MSRTATVILVGVGLVSAYLWRVTLGRAITDSSLDLVLLWLASIVGLVIAATGPPRREHAAAAHVGVARQRRCADHRCDRRRRARPAGL